MKKYYRNKIELFGYEPDTLWYLAVNGISLILENDDEYFTLPFAEYKELFYLVTI